MAESYYDRLEAEKEAAGSSNPPLPSSSTNPLLPTTTSNPPVPTTGGLGMLNTASSSSAYPSAYPASSTPPVPNTINLPGLADLGGAAGGSGASSGNAAWGTTNFSSNPVGAAPNFGMQVPSTSMSSTNMQPRAGSAMLGAGSRPFQPVPNVGVGGQISQTGANTNTQVLTLMQKFDLLKAKKTKLTEKLCRFFKLLEQRMERQATLSAPQIADGKQRIRLGCQQLCQFKVDVPQFLQGMERILKSQIPPTLQPTLTKAMEEYKETVTAIYRVKQAQQAQQAQKQASLPSQNSFSALPSTSISTPQPFNTRPLTYATQTPPYRGTTHGTAPPAWQRH